MFLQRFNTENEHAAARRQPQSFFGEQAAGPSFFTPGIQQQASTANTKSVTIDDILGEAQGTLNDLGRIQQQMQQSLCELLRSMMQGFTNTNDQVNKNTPGLLDIFASYAATCSSLRQYITVSPKKIEAGHYKTHNHYKGNDDPADKAAGRFDNDDWHAAVKKYLNTGDRKEIAKVGGFYDRSNDTINLPKDSSFGNALHESVHRLSKTFFMGRFGSHLNEGLTQYFTNLLLSEAGLAAETTSAYGPNLADAKLLISKLGGHDLPARVYFMGDVHAIEQILTALGLRKEINAGIILNPARILKAIRTP